jgi:hypothetical protein
MQAIQGWRSNVLVWAAVAGRGEGLERLRWWACWRSWGEPASSLAPGSGLPPMTAKPKELR